MIRLPQNDLAQLQYQGNDEGVSLNIQILNPTLCFQHRELNEGRPSCPVRRAEVSQPYYHYAFAILLGSTRFVTFSHMWDSWIDNQSSFDWIVVLFIIINRVFI